MSSTHGHPRAVASWPITPVIDSLRGRVCPWRPSSQLGRGVWNLQSPARVPEEQGIRGRPARCPDAPRKREANHRRAESPTSHSAAACAPASSLAAESRSPEANRPRDESTDGSTAGASALLVAPLAPAASQRLQFETGSSVQSRYTRFISCRILPEINIGHSLVAKLSSAGRRSRFLTHRTSVT